MQQNEETKNEEKNMTVNQEKILSTYLAPCAWGNP
jgi:hypothetical protein